MNGRDYLFGAPDTETEEAFFNAGELTRMLGLTPTASHQQPAPIGVPADYGDDYADLFQPSSSAPAQPGFLFQESSPPPASPSQSHLPDDSQTSQIGLLPIEDLKNPETELKTPSAEKQLANTSNQNPSSARPQRKRKKIKQEDDDLDYVATEDGGVKTKTANKSSPSLESSSDDKRERNKDSAHRYRIRKKQFVNELEAQLSALKQDVESNVKKIEALQSENAQLKMKIAELKKPLSAQVKQLETERDTLKTQVQRFEQQQQAQIPRGLPASAQSYLEYTYTSQLQSQGGMFSGHQRYAAPNDTAHTNGHAKANGYKPR